MATWLKQSTSIDVGVGPFVDSVDGFTPETGLTITQPDVRLKKNAGAWAQKAAAQTLTHEENGWYEVTLDATDTNTLGILIVAIYESGALPVWREFEVVAANIYDSIIGGGDTLDVQVTGLAADVITATSIQANAITDAKVASDVTIASVTGAVGSVTGAVGSVTGAVGSVAGAVASVTGAVGSITAGGITAASFAAGAIDAAAIAANAIGASELAADAVTEIAAAIGAAYIVAGTADSGTTTTMVDAARTEADTDYWKGALILFTSGTIAGQSRIITGFTPGSDTITFAPALTQVVGTQTYEIRAAGAGNLEASIALISGYELDLVPCFTSTAGTTVNILATIKKGGAFVQVATLDAAATLALAVREYGAGGDLYTIAAATVSADGTFSLTKATPGYTADRLYKYTATIVILGVTYTGINLIPNLG